MSNFLDPECFRRIIKGVREMAGASVDVTPELEFYEQEKLTGAEIERRLSLNEHVPFDQQLDWMFR